VSSLLARHKSNLTALEKLPEFAQAMDAVRDSWVKAQLARAASTVAGEEVSKK
jgi:hypothetical protein